MILKQPVTTPAAWKGSELIGDESWIHHLSTEDIAEIDSALADVKFRGLEFPRFTAEDFSLPVTKPRLQSFAEDLEHGRGFLLLRGLPVNRYSEDDIRVHHNHSEQALNRKMLRLWLKMPNARQLAPDFPGRNGFPVPASVTASH